MKMGIIIGTNEPEQAWNAFRFGNTAIKGGHSAKIFLISAGVEAEQIQSGKFNVAEQLAKFVSAGGKILACGTCLEARKKGGSEACPISTMKDLLAMVEESDKVVSFG